MCQLRPRAYDSTDTMAMRLDATLADVPFPVTPLEIMRFAVGPAVAGLALTGRTVGRTKRAGSASSTRS